ncbi:MAG: hypothetical protein HYY04_17355, partial [Chloroflexi bacterium]|nr:hypothetical protein [Chloroflexota bacterium]
MKTERLYYRDSALRTFRARVVSAEPAAGATGSAWNVVLDRTAFYPTSGGQPNDLGTLAGRPVVDVIDRGETVAHVVAEPTVPLSVLERGPGGMCANSGPDAAAPGADLTPCPPFLSGSDAERGSRHPPPRVG